MPKPAVKYPAGHVPRGGQKPVRKPRQRPEETVQAHAIRVLCGAGYTVHQTSVRVRQITCAREEGGCGRKFYPPPGEARYGTTPGTPDLLVTRRTWPRGVWLGIEVKAPGGRPTPAQAALLAEGRIAIIHSPEEALQAVHDMEAALFPRSNRTVRFGALCGSEDSNHGDA
jgi:hypothetical protein